jgi:hypothetical protein
MRRSVIALVATLAAIIAAIITTAAPSFACPQGYAPCGSHTCCRQ